MVLGGCSDAGLFDRRVASVSGGALPQRCAGRLGDRCRHCRRMCCPGASGWRVAHPFDRQPSDSGCLCDIARAGLAGLAGRASAGRLAVAGCLGADGAAQCARRPAPQPHVARHQRDGCRHMVWLHGRPGGAVSARFLQCRWDDRPAHGALRAWPGGVGAYLVRAWANLPAPGRSALLHVALCALHPDWRMGCHRRSALVPTSRPVCRLCRCAAGACAMAALRS